MSKPNPVNEGRKSGAQDRFDWAIGHLGVRKGERILEIGCGSGEALARLRARSPAASLFGLDRSQVAIARSRKKLEARGFEDVELIKGELPGAPIPHELDRIFAINVNQFWVKPDDIFADVLARLRRGGTLLLVYETPGAVRTEDIRRKLTEATGRPGLRVDRIVAGPDSRRLLVKATKAG